MALLQVSGSVLGLESQSGAGAGVFPEVFRLLSPYLKPLNGEVWITNDPSSGCANWDEFVLWLQLDPQFILLLGLHRRSQIRLTKPSQFQCFRVPPTPIRTGGQWSLPILEAMQAHPLAPSDFLVQIQELIPRIEEILKNWQNLKSCGLLPDLKSLDETKIFWRQQLDSVVAQQNQLDFRLNEHEILKLKLRWSPTGWIFDWSGTQLSSHSALSHSLVIAACHGALLEELAPQAVASASLFEWVKVQNPKCLETPALTDLNWGRYILFPLMRSLCRRLVQILKPKLAGKDSAREAGREASSTSSTPPPLLETESPLWMQFEWEGRRIWSGNPLGLGFEPESFESNFPVTLRKLSSGRFLEWTLSSPARLTWMNFQNRVQVLYPDGSLQNIESISSGELSLSSGCVLRFSQ